MKNIKKFLPYLINASICIAIFLISLYICDIFPFGDITIGKSDALVQFKPMLYNFIMELKTKTIELYSFNNGLGNPFTFNFLYYLSSPLNLIALFFKDANSMYLSAILIKLIIASFIMTFYAKKKTNNNFFTTIITITYIFSSWFIAYYYYLPWLDIFMIFPLFNYGLEKILNQEKPYIYIFSLSYAILTNFYLSFAIIFYTILYFIIYEIYTKKKRKEIINTLCILILSSLVSLLIILPFVYSLYSSYLKMGISFSQEINQGFNTSIINIIKSLFYGNISFTVNTSGSIYPNIALNTFALLNIIYYFFNKNINKKEKLLVIIIIIICLLPIFINQFDFVLNFFHNVNGLTFRYSYLYIFLEILLLIRNLNTINLKQKYLFHLISIPLILILLILKDKINFEIFILNIVILLSINILIFFYKNNKISKLLLTLLIIIESIVAVSSNISSDIKKEAEYFPNNFNTTPIKYRLNRTNYNIPEYSNYNLYTNENVTYLLSSMHYNSTINLLSNLGCQATTNYITYCGDEHKLFSMFFNIKNDKYYLEKIFAVNNDILIIDLDPYNIKNSLEYLSYATTGIKDIFDKHILESTEKDNKYYFNTDYKFYLIENGNTIIPQTYQEFYIEKNETVPDTATIYTYNQEKLNEIYNKLKDNQIKYTTYSDSHIEGTINIKENQIIFTSIPYDTSWEIKIDGKKIEPTKILDSLIGIECSKGTHTISMKYKKDNPIFLIISIFTIILILIKIIKEHKKDTNFLN